MGLQGSCVREPRYDTIAVTLPENKKMNITTTAKNHKIVWEYHSSTGKRLYIDFRVEGLDAIFRVCDSDGVSESDLNGVVEDIGEAYDFLEYFVMVGDEVFNEVNHDYNWGQGWEWHEMTHPKLPSIFKVAIKTSWYTVPYNGKSASVKSMDELYGDSIDRCGVEVKKSHSHNHPPQHRFYVFREWNLTN